MDAFEAISAPEPSSFAGKKYFSLSEASRSLILVTRIVRDVVERYRRLRELHKSYQSLDQIGDISAADKTRQQYVATTEHLAALREELEDIGCELKDFEIGLVDFPALRDQREVYLCWKLGEESVQYWHEVSGGFSERHAADGQTA